MRCAIAIFLFLAGSFSAGAQTNMELVKGGTYVPLYGNKDTGVPVADFYMDVTPVTHADYLAFVKAYPTWKKSEVSPLFANENYLRSWRNDTTPDPSLLNSPVNYVSWFAAKAYCECQGKRLPTIDEWEFAAMADGKSRDARKDSLFNLYVIRGYETANTHSRTVGSTPKNYWGIQDLHGLVWEWTSDFNAIILSGESRKTDNTNSINLWCGGAAINANDLMDYAAFLRYALRSSLKARFGLKSLGFRCVRDAEPL